MAMTPEDEKFMHAVFDVGELLEDALDCVSRAKTLEEAQAICAKARKTSNEMLKTLGMEVTE